MTVSEITFIRIIAGPVQEAHYSARLSKLEVNNFKVAPPSLRIDKAPESYRNPFCFINLCVSASLYLFFETNYLLQFLEWWCSFSGNTDVSDK